MNPCIDESTSVRNVVADRASCVAARQRANRGGGGINVPRALHRLGANVLAIYPAGGPAGDLLRSLLEHERVAQLPLPISAWTRENVNVLEEETGRQFRFVFPGPRLAAPDWEACLRALESLEPSPASLGAAGVLLIRAEGAEQVVSPTVPVRSTVGAGDTLLAGIVLRLQQGHAFPQAVRFGVAAAAATVMRPGTQLCRPKDAERLYEKISDGSKASAQPCG